MSAYFGGTEYEEEGWELYWQWYKDSPKANGDNGASIESDRQIRGMWDDSVAKKQRGAANQRTIASLIDLARQHGWDMAKAEAQIAQELARGQPEKAKQSGIDVSAVEALVLPAFTSFAGQALPVAQPKIIVIPARAFRWRELLSVAPRPVLGAGGHYCRKFLSATIGQSGKGRTSHDLVEAVGFACGKNHFDDAAPFRHGPLNVWYWNLEDPWDEIERRILAIMAFHKLRDKDIGDRLVINSGRDQTLAIAEPGPKEGIQFVEPLIEAFIKEGQKLKTDVIIIDPFARMTIWLLMPLRSAGPPSATN